MNNGYGTHESHYLESLSVLDTETGNIADFPDERTSIRDKQTLFSGLAFSRDGAHLYASMASVSFPEGDGKRATGNGVVVYSFHAGQIAPERFIPLPLQPLTPGRKTWMVGGEPGEKGLPYPASIAVATIRGAEKLLIAENLADDTVLMDAASGKIEKRFDLSESNAVPATFPVHVLIAPGGQRAFVALWNSSEIAELDLAAGTVRRKLLLLPPTTSIAPGSHPCFMALSPDGRTVYVALENRDAVAAVDVHAGAFAAKGYFTVHLPGQQLFGAEPVALAVNGDGSRVYVANMASDSVAVLDTKKLAPVRTTEKKDIKEPKDKWVAPDGFVPTEWLPICMAFLPSKSGGKLYIATGKGRGTGPNNFPTRPVSGLPAPNPPHGGGTYIGTLLYGSLATLDESDIAPHLDAWTRVVLKSNRMNSVPQKISFADRSPSRLCASSSLTMSASWLRTRRTSSQRQSACSRQRKRRPRKRRSLRNRHP